MSKELFLGGDVSKGYADFIIIDRNKNTLEKDFQLDDTFEGHNSLFKILSDLLSKNSDTVIYCAVESTGGLENNWLSFLKRIGNVLNVKAARINPIGPYALNKAAMHRNGNDAISARTIAEYLIVYPEKVDYNTEDPFVSLRKLYNMIELLKKQKTQLLNLLNITLYASMPFLLTYCKNGVPNWLLLLLSKYPSAEKLLRAHESSIAAIRYISHNRAKEIKQKAKENIGAQVDEATTITIKTLVNQILHLKNIIKQNKNYMIKQFALPEIEIIKSFNGIGYYSAIGLFLNIVSIERFPSAKHLASYFGLHPINKQSGDGTSGFKMSKKGRAVPRQILFMVARTAINTNPLIKEIYIEHLRRGKTKMSAIGVCMHKIIRIIFGMLKNNTTFNPEIDKRNKNKIYTKKGIKQQIENKKRRYQDISEEAPISRRQSKKRKENHSQTVQDDMCGIKAPLSVV